MAGKKKKHRTSFRKNREVRTRDKDLTRSFRDDDVHDLAQHERISGKGELTRKRTVAGADLVEDDAGMVTPPSKAISCAREYCPSPKSPSPRSQVSVAVYDAIRMTPP